MNGIIELVKVIILGIVEGITEWLPISSTGHMRLVDAFMPLQLNKAFTDMFFVVIQLGAILAVMVVFFHKLNPLSPRKTPGFYGLRCLWQLCQPLFWVSS